MLKVQGRDKGSSVAFDYDNKNIQRMTAISTQYTVSKNAMFQYRLTTFNVLTNVCNVQRFTSLLIAICDDELMSRT